MSAANHYPHQWTQRQRGSNKSRRLILFGGSGLLHALQSTQQYFMAGNGVNQDIPVAEIVVVTDDNNTAPDWQGLTTVHVSKFEPNLDRWHIVVGTQDTDFALSTQVLGALVQARACFDIYCLKNDGRLELIINDARVVAPSSSVK